MLNNHFANQNTELRGNILLGRFLIINDWAAPGEWYYLKLQ